MERMNAVFACAAASAFGLEGAISGELKRLGMRNVQPENGFVRFQADLKDVFACNLRLRFSDRVYLIMAEAECLTFEDLFQLVRSVPWERFVSGTEFFHITAQCARSRLMSPRDCQSITKKSILERLKAKTSRTVFPETGAEFPVHVHIHSDSVRILLDTSGSSLSRRGYRTWNGEAPLRETLAAALVEFSPWRPGLPLYDPCCGTGPLLIEAALRQAHIAPGVHRSFAMESLPCFPGDQAKAIREKTASESDPDRIGRIAGSDLDSSAIELAARHLRQAGLDGRIPLSTQALQTVQLSEKNGVFLCNPPYGERLSDTEQCRILYRDLRLLQERHPTWFLCAISSDPGFEKAYGRRADRKRRLYNGRLECQFYFFSPRKA